MSLTFYSCGDDDKEDDKEFVWNGDWNDPNDPNYKADGYNPIVGLWKSDNNPSIGVYFTEDFKSYRIKFTSNGTVGEKYYEKNYVINDKAYNLSPPQGGIWRYRVEGNKFYDTPNLNDDNDWRSYTRVED